MQLFDKFKLHSPDSVIANSSVYQTFNVFNVLKNLKIYVPMYILDIIYEIFTFKFLILEYIFSKSCNTKTNKLIGIPDPGFNSLFSILYLGFNKF